MTSISTLGESRSAVLQLLLGQELTAKEIAKTVKLSETAIRAQLDALEAHGFVISKVERVRARGRPKKYYGLTQAGLDAFPRRYELLLESVIDTLVKNLGEEKASEMLTEAGHELGLRLRPKFDPDATPMLRLHMIVRLLNEMGFMASLKFERERPVLYRQNCVFHKTASARHELICENFDNAFMRTLLSGLDISLVQCIHDSKGACKNVIDRL